MTDTQGGRERDQPKGPNLWIGPVLATVVIVVPVLVLVFSNTESIEVTWAGFAVTAPRWVALLAAFVGGMVAGPLLGWVWRRWRRHRRHLRDERDTLRRHRVDD